MTPIAHMTLRTSDGVPLVRDEHDSIALVQKIAAGLGSGVLAYCVMTNHVHLLVEGDLTAAASAFGAALRAHARRFNARHGRSGRLVEGAPDVIPKHGSRAFAFALDYLHKNPLKTTPPLAESVVEYPWSSAPAFAGLSRTSFPNVARARALLGPDGGWAVPRRFPLADTEPVVVPCAAPELLLAATARVYGVGRGELASRLRSPVLSTARTVYVRLGRLEGYSDAQLAPLLGRTRSRVTRIASEPIDVEGVRVARTLLRAPPLRRRLDGPALAMSPKR